MGLMDILAHAASAASGSGSNPSQSSLLTMVMALVTKFPGGLSGLLEKLKAAGLEQQVESWVGNGANLPVSPEQINVALGAGNIDAVAKEAGVSHDVATTAIAHHLPDVVNAITPDATVPEGDLAAEAMALFKSRFIK